MSLLSSSRCVLILGDEGLQIYNVSRLNAQFVDFLPWDTVDFGISVRDLIVKKCKRKPVVVLNDMVEQHYRKERIPKVSFFDKSNVIKRRLSVAFPNYKIRAALKLKDKKLGVGQEGSGDAYLFAAIAQSEAFNKTINAIRMAGAPIIGFYLLPIEASAMVKTLSTKLSKGRGSRSSWTIFVGQHHGGGLRQIVTRNGELALTRLTPIVDTDIEPELWAKEVANELNATMSYLARFGYHESDGLEIVIVSNEAAQLSLQSAIDIECELHVMTSQQIGSLLGVRLGVQEDLRYADPLHAAFTGRKNKFLLPMESAAIYQLTQPRRVASFLMICLLVGAAYFAFDAFSSWKKYLSVKDQLVVATQQNSSLKQEYRREIIKKKEMGFDFLYVNNSIEIFEDLQKQKMKPLPVVREIGRSLGPDVKLDKFVISVKEVEVERQEDDYSYDVESTEQKNIEYFLEAITTISFPSSVDPDVGVESVNNIRDRLQNSLPEYEVSVIKQVADLSYTGNFVGEAGEAPRENIPEKYNAEIMVRGKIQ